MPLPIACRSLSISATSIGKIDAGARHHLPLERIAMQVDDARQHHQAAGIDADASRGHRPNPRRRSRRPAIRSEASRISPPSRARPPSMHNSVTMRHFVVGLPSRLMLAAASYFCEKVLDSELAEIGQGPAQRLMVPVPPRELRQPVGHRFGKPPPDRPRRIARDDGVGRDVLGDDGAGRDHRAGADRCGRQHDGAVADPDVVADMDAMPAPPFEELGLVALARKIGAGAIGEMRLRGPVHRVIARVDPRHRRDRAELSDRRVGDLRVVHDVGIVVHRRLRAGWSARRPRV